MLKDQKVELLPARTTMHHGGFTIVFAPVFVGINQGNVAGVNLGGQFSMVKNYLW